MTKFHLRRIKMTSNHSVLSVPPDDDRKTLILLKERTLFGRQHGLVDVLLLHGDPVAKTSSSNLISRNHAEIIHRTTETGDDEYLLLDNSLNGTYLNDIRVPKSSIQALQTSCQTCVLKEKDIIKFGHKNGAHVKPGSFAPQMFTEFTFIVEKVQPNSKYIGFHDSFQRKMVLACFADSPYVTEYQEASMTASSSDEQVIREITAPSGATAVMNGETSSSSKSTIPHIHCPKPSYPSTSGLSYTTQGFSLPQNPIQLQPNPIQQTQSFLEMNLYSYLKQNAFISAPCINSHAPFLNESFPTSYPFMMNITTRDINFILNQPRISSETTTSAYPGAEVPEVPRVPVDVVPSDPNTPERQQQPGTSCEDIDVNPSLEATNHSTSNKEASVLASKTTPMISTSAVATTSSSPIMDEDEQTSTSLSSPERVEKIGCKNTPSPSVVDNIELESDYELDVGTPEPKYLDQFERKRRRTNELSVLLKGLNQSLKNARKDVSQISDEEKAKKDDNDDDHDDEEEEEKEDEVVEKVKPKKRGRKGRQEANKKLKALSEDSSGVSESEDEQTVQRVEKKKKGRKPKLIEKKLDAHDSNRDLVPRRGRKAKNAKKADVVKRKPGRQRKDERTTDKDTCGLFDKCKVSSDMEQVEWVQCDDCSQWWHMMCKFGNNVPYTEKTFVCCKSTNVIAKKRARNA